MMNNYVSHLERIHIKTASTRAAIVVAIITGLLAIALRWHFVTHAQVMQPLYLDEWKGDAADFYRYAWHLANEGMFSSDLPHVSNPRPDSFRDAGYPAFLALCMTMTHSYDTWYALVLLTQVILGGLTVAFTVLALRDALPLCVLISGGVLLAFWPHLVVLPGFIFSENLTACFFAITVFCLGEAAKYHSRAYIVAAGISLAITALSNSVVAPLFIPLAIIFTRRKLFIRRDIVVFILVVATPLVAWNIRNAANEGPFSSSFRAQVNFVQGSWPTYHDAGQLLARHDPTGVQTIDAIDDEIMLLHFDPLTGMQTIVQRMEQSPSTYVKWYLGKPALLWGWNIGLGSGDIYPSPTRNSPFMINKAMRTVEALAYALNGVIGVLALAGVFIVAARPSSPVPLVTFALAGAWVTLIYGLLQSDARYSIPYRTAEIALAGLAIAVATSYIRSKMLYKKNHV